MGTKSYKRFGALSATGTLFQVPASHEYLLDDSGITVCNHDTALGLVYIYRNIGDTSGGTIDIIYYGNVEGGEIMNLLCKACFAATDSITVTLPAGNTVSVTAGGLDFDNS